MVRAGSGSDATYLATRMNLEGIRPPPLFLPTPGRPTIPWETWKSRFQTYLIATGGDAFAADRQRAILLHCLGEEGQRIHETLPPAVKLEDTETVFDLTLRQLDGFFIPRVNVIVERFTFRQRTQRPEESTAEYVSVLRGLASTCRFGNMTDDMIRDMVVEKTTHPRLREKLLQDPDLTLDRALAAADAFERALREAAVMSGQHPAPVVATLAQPLPRRQPRRKNQSKSQHQHQSPCTNCGRSTHPTGSRDCPARGRTCSACGRTGHFAAVCRSSAPVSSAPAVPDRRREVVKEATVLTVSPKSSQQKVLCPVLLSVGDVQHSINMQVDTGATCSLLSLQYARELFKGKEFQPSTSRLFGFGRTPVPVTGTLPVTVTFGDRSTAAQFFLVDTPSTEALMGLDLIEKLGLTIHPASGQVFSVEEQQQQSLPAIAGYTHKIFLRPDAQPTVYKLRRLPLAVREEVSTELQRLLDADIIERIDASEWVSPLVVSRKPSGQIRLCVDLRGPNSQIVAEVHPLPTIEELQSHLLGQVYSKIDLQSAYHQLELHPDSRDVTAFITHAGLMRFKRVPFGLVSAGSAFQRLLDDLLHGVPGCGHYLDDIIVSGSCQAEHDQRLRTVLDRLRAARVTVNHAKSSFSKSEVDFCGHRMSAVGVTPTASSVKAAADAPRPETLKELRSFLGLAGWFRKFIGNYAEVVRPMASLLKKDTPFQWTSEVEQSFQRVKRLVSTSPVLRPFRQDLPTVVTSDASDRGAGAVLSQVHPDGSEHPVAFWSRSFTDTERRYSVSEREALSAVQAVERWKVYLWGRKFTLRTDHSALTTLLSPRFSGRAGARVARWQARLLPYSYEVVYTPGSRIPAADALSRLPLPDTGPAEEDDDVVALVTDEATGVLSEDDVREASLLDDTLQQLRSVIASGWPASARSCPPDVRPFFPVRHELHVRRDSVVLRGTDRVVVPAALTERYLQLAHRAHDGIVRTKQLLRSLCWWPGFDRAVTDLVKTCDQCQRSDKVLSQKARPAPLQPVSFPARPWSKLGIDIVGPIVGAPQSARYAVTLTDYHSKWVEVALTAGVGTCDITKILSVIWAREGYPDDVVTDNDPQFISREFATYLQERKIRHLKSSVYWPRGNGAVERFNRSLKTWILAAAQQSDVPFQAYLQGRLARYRATPHCTTGISPSELLHGRKMRLDLPALDDRFCSIDVARRVRKQQHRNRRHYNSRHRARPTRIAVGDTVCIRRPGHAGKTTARFSKPLRVVRRLGRATFGLSDGSRWNVAHLAKMETGGSPPATVPASPPPLVCEDAVLGTPPPTSGGAVPVPLPPPSCGGAALAPPSPLADGGREPVSPLSTASGPAPASEAAVAPPCPPQRGTLAPPTQGPPPSDDPRGGRELPPSSRGRRRFRPARLDL